MRGLPIVFVIKGSDVDIAGVKPGDKVLALNDMRVENMLDYLKALKINPICKSMLVERDGKKMYFEWKNKNCVLN
jgi:predicted metalloprotease with PDZ domain